jgi:hypothetical protein
MLVTAMILTISNPSEAACHHYRYWAFNFSQHCRAVAYVQERVSRHPLPLIHERIEIPLPSLENIDWGLKGDDRWRGIALLRALSDGP